MENEILDIGKKKKKKLKKFTSHGESVWKKNAWALMYDIGTA